MIKVKASITFCAVVFCTILTASECDHLDVITHMTRFFDYIAENQQCNYEQYDLGLLRSAFMERLWLSKRSNEDRAVTTVRDLWGKYCLRKCKLCR